MEDNLRRSNMNDEICFTQFLRPDGRTRQVFIERPPDIVTKALMVVESGGRFEIEVLSTGEISMTVEHSGDYGPIALYICPNGPDVPSTVDSLVHKAYTFIIRRRPSED